MQTDKKKEVKQDAETSNMPDRQRPVYNSNENESENTVTNESDTSGDDFWGGDYGSEEARSDSEKGNTGHTGSEPASNPAE